MPWFKTTAEYLGTQLCLEFESDTDLSDEVWAEAERLEAKFSRFRPESGLSVFNASLDTWHQIDAEWQHLLETADTLKQQTNGILDITVQSVLESWGYDADYSLQEQENSGSLGEVLLKDGSFKASAPIDFGSIGKGYFLDRVKLILSKHEVQNSLINAGGDIWAKGADEEGETWKVFLEDPRNSELVIGEMEIDDVFLCSSSAQKRAWRDRHHLVETKNLAPAQDMKAVHIEHRESGILCDGLSTTLFVLGYEKSKQFAQNNNLNVMLIAPSGEIWKSETFAGQLYTT